MNGRRISRGGVARLAGVFATAGALGFFVPNLASVFHKHSSLEERPPKSARQSADSDSASVGLRSLVAFTDALEDAARSEAAAAQRIARIKALAREIPSDAIPALATNTADWPTREREVFLSELHARWAEADPAAAMAHCDRIKDSVLQAGVAERVLGVWMKQDAKAALAWIKAQPEGDDRLRLVKSFINSPDQPEPTLALAASRLLPHTRTGNELRERVLLRAAEKDPKAAAETVLALPSDSALRRSETPLQIARLWIKQDSQGALKWLQSDPARTGVLFPEVLLRALGEHNPQQALQWLGDVSQHPQSHRIGYVIAGWAKRDPAAARAYANSLPPGTARNTALSYALYELGTAKNDVPTIVAINRERAPDSNKELEEHLIYMIKEHSTDPRTIMAALKQLPQDPLNVSLIQGFISRWAKMQPDEAAQYLQSSGLLAEQHEAVAEIVGSWAKANPAHAVDWAKGLPPGQARETALSTALQFLAESDYQRAAQLMMQLPQKARAEVSRSVAENWAEHDPAAAATWASQQTDPVAHELANDGVARAWARQNPGECAQWLESLPAGSVRDRAVDTYARITLQANPAAAIQWAGTVQDTDRRRRLLNYLAIYWRDREPVSATAWIKTTPLLSPAAKQWVLSEGPRR